MDVAELALPGSYLITPRPVARRRDAAAEWYRHDALAEAVGYRPELTQASCVPARLGAVHGLHWVDVPPGEGRYATCVDGAVLYVVVDLRVGSLTFGEYTAAELDGVRRRAVYAAEGLGHGFVALTDTATVVTLTGPDHDRAAEHVLDPHDPRLALPWSDGSEGAPDFPASTPGAPSRLSPSSLPPAAGRAADVPNFLDALEDGLLPRLEDCRAVDAARRVRAGTAVRP